MPPRADNPRQFRSEEKVRASEDLPIRSLADLKDNEICIDGFVHSLDGFRHPGGEQIKLFGGNDVTVQYKMIHPRHTAANMKKMRKVGVIPDYECDYKFDTEFEREIKKEVFEIVKRNKEYGTPGYITRAVVYLTIYFGCLVFWIVQGSTLTLALIWGLSHASIGLNVQHDANHGAAGSPKHLWINTLFGFGADMIGGSKWLWMEQHWTHHAYTNGWKDADKHSAEPMVIFQNYPLGHAKRRWYHRFQALFVLPILSLYWLSMIFSMDVLTLEHSGAKDVGMKFDNEFIRQRTKYAILSRLIYVLGVIVPPFFHHDPATAFYHLMIMGAFGSAVISSLFVVSHNFEGARRLTDEDQTANGEKPCWFKAQVETSSTYGGLMSGWLTGGLNFQVEHHLFPRMSSAWYPVIAPKVREICKKHNVKYTYYPWIWQNLTSTIKFIHASGMGSEHAQTEEPARLARLTVGSVLFLLYAAIGRAVVQHGGDSTETLLVTMGGVAAFLLAVPIMRVVLNAFAPTTKMTELMTEASDLQSLGYLAIGGYALWKASDFAVEHMV